MDDFDRVQQEEDARIERAKEFVGKAYKSRYESFYQYLFLIEYRRWSGYRVVEVQKPKYSGACLSMIDYLLDDLLEEYVEVSIEEFNRAFDEVVGELKAATGRS